MEESAMRAATRAGVALMIVLGVVVSAPHADSDWVMLGERTVNHSVDHDQIVVTKSEGDFHRIALRVEGAPVQFYKVEVHYANGQVQDIELKDEIPAGGESRAIDLTGKERVIESVVFNYRTDDLRDQKAVVQLWGLG
jgi:hypothetical protein